MMKKGTDFFQSKENFHPGVKDYATVHNIFI